MNKVTFYKEQICKQASDMSFELEGSALAKNQTLKLLAWLEWCGNVGHSCMPVKVSIDGDGNGRIALKFKDKKNQKEYDNIRKKITDYYDKHGDLKKVWIEGGDGEVKIDFYKDKIVKQAMEKQAKGWLRNTAINVAQDFITAGNPLNPSSHVFGSAADGVLMEGLDRKLAKEEAKIKKQEEEQKKKNSNSVL